MKNGFHVMEERVLDEEEISTFNTISVIRFLKLVQDRKVGQFEEYTVYGLEDLFANARDPESLAQYIHQLLRVKANFLVNSSSLFQFILKQAEVQIWQGNPIIKLRGNRKIYLHQIFGSMESPQDNPNWFWHQLNVES